MDIVAALTDDAYLSGINKWVGVIIAMVGAMIAAPDGTKMVIRAPAARARGLINRWRAPATQSRSVSVSATATLGALTATATARSWKPGDPVDDRIEALRAHISVLEGHLNQTARAVDEEKSAREAAISELGNELRVGLDELHKLLEQKDRQLARVDARALPLIGFGIVLSGVPEELAGFLGSLGLLLPVAGFAWMVWILVKVERSRRARNRVLASAE
ncbi:hypothetical protein [Nonomuraea sp. NPDC050643]|uniref:hypothetical protein n=1 Tax=Nonomuraea sp. NPDC050643 TaxID=3155660 RepID=UPI0034097A8E